MHGQPVCEAELHAQINSSGDWKVVDLCISAGVDGLSKKIQEVKDFVDERVDALSRKQDDLAESQDEMKDQLEDVQQNISGVTYTCTCIMLQINLSSVSHSQFAEFIRGFDRQWLESQCTRRRCDMHACTSCRNCTGLPCCGHFVQHSTSSPVQSTVQGAERRSQLVVWSQFQSWCLFAVPVLVLHLVLVWHKHVHLCFQSFPAVNSYTLNPRHSNLNSTHPQLQV